MPTRPRLTRKLALWLGAIALLAIGLFVAVPYLYIHAVEGPAPTALAASSPAEVAPASGSADGVWKISEGSQAGYRVPEVLGGQKATAVGRTRAVTGQVTVVGTQVTDGGFTVDLTKVTSDQSQRDGQFRGRIMETSRYPTATFVLTRPAELGALATGAGTETVKATGNLTLHGVTRPVTAELTAVRSGSGVQVGGQIPVTFADYGIANPSFGNLVQTGDTGTIEVLLQLTRS